jgi:Ca2+-binding RTX toxin-like protein
MLLLLVMAGIALAATSLISDDQTPGGENEPDATDDMKQRELPNSEGLDQDESLEVTTLNDFLAPGSVPDDGVDSDSPESLTSQASADRLKYYGAEADDLHGTSTEDTLSGVEGNDTLSGKGGDDRLLGGDGDDSLNGGSGHDCGFGGRGSDLILGGTGGDTLAGGRGVDILDGGEGSDHISGWDDSRTDYLAGSSGDDRLELGEGDRARGGSGQDEFILGVGDRPAVIEDFQAGRDQIVIIYDRQDPPPFIEVVVSEDGAYINVEDECIARIPNAVELDVSQVLLVAR